MIFWKLFRYDCSNFLFQYLQEYKLSNLVLVTESLTFIAGTQSFPALLSWYNLCTPVTLSSTIPKYYVEFLKMYQITRHFKDNKMKIPLIALNAVGCFLSIKWVASPPSSKIIFGCQPSAAIQRSMHHQKSSSVSPRQANTL